LIQHSFTKSNNWCELEIEPNSQTGNKGSPFSLMIGDDNTSFSADSSEMMSFSIAGSPAIYQPRKVRVACIPCQTAKKKCDLTRPCKRCVNKRRSAECRDRIDESDVFFSSLLLSSPFNRRLSSSTAESTVSEVTPIENSGFWDQFGAGMNMESLKKVLTWSYLYSPMYVSDMIKANTISRRSYLNLVAKLVNEKTMLKVADDMARMAGLINQPITNQDKEKENGVPYQRTDYSVRSGENLNINSQFLGKVSEEWSDVKTENDLLTSVMVYKVGFQEVVEDTSGDLNSFVTIEFNQVFEETMGVHLETFKHYLAEGTNSRCLTCNPAFWIFNIIHWDTVLDFVLYSFFNTDSMMKGTFITSCWQPEFLKQGVYSSMSVNLIGHCSYEDEFTRIQYTFGFRRVLI
jgi:hypothetical protein